MPRKVLIMTLAFAEGEKNIKFQASDLPCSSSGPKLVLVMRAGTASGFHAFALASAFVYMSDNVSFGSFIVSIGHASSAREGDDASSKRAAAMIRWRMAISSFGARWIWGPVCTMEAR